MEPKNKKKDEVPAGKTMKIRLFPNKEQDRVLRRWFGTARWTYNRCLEAVKNNRMKARSRICASNVSVSLCSMRLLGSGYERHLERSVIPP